MKDCCEKCGKELSFFERSLKISNARVNLQYDALCSECHKTLKEGIAQIEAMYQRVVGILKENYQIANLAAVDVDTLIFLAVEALLAIEPNYYSEKTSLHQTVINRSERTADKQNDMARIVYKVLDYGFAENLEKAGFDSSRNFAAYMLKNTLYLEQLAANCSEEVPRTYVNAFFSVRGFIMERIETKSLIYLPIDAGTVLDYIVTPNGDYDEFAFKNLRYPTDDAEVHCFLNTGEQSDSFKKTLDKFNTRTVKKEERRLRDTLAIINRGIRRDLRSLKPKEDISKIPLDCILLCLVKNFKADPEGRNADIMAADGMAVDLLLKEYSANLEALSLGNREAVADYLNKNCMYVESVGLMYNKQEPDSGYAFFTQRGFITAFRKSRQILFIYEDHYPNDIYLPCYSLMVNGAQYLQLPMGEEAADEEGFRELTGLVFTSRDVAKIKDITAFFERNNSFYQMEKYMEAENRIYEDDEMLAEVQRISGHLFRDFGYVPYCLYDEWYVIQKELRENDTLLARFIPEKKAPDARWASGDVIYAPKIIDTFRKGASELQETLHLEDISVARGLLWCNFKETLVEAMASEWVRIGGDMVTEADNLMTAFLKYSHMDTIEPAKTYYIGLFIYYLMDKNILKEPDFLDNYDKAVQTFLECWREVGKKRPDARVIEPTEVPETAETTASEEPAAEAEEADVQADELEE